ncbi:MULTISPECIES: DUF3185 family protein [Idiomarinaceae]|uniref:Uncharacterized protein DUF3185 n=4 Tax=Pseudidiomarina TaxID=2800384 RepID=A0A368V3W9_9GAMM|nr:MULTISPECIES: DUF3185 family protein [Idiomarinaceae]MDT7526508.1 DUF3185 family protein [Pseudidiomarina sp. GXY010]MRJ42616.1 DUF3185 family protein [Idiomarina sp. FeN1]NCU57964.1 DUF3185 family protein [Idiomarina sp. FenA--70]NCU60516.1 DUF3185 family protein [Idiomarina sp. FenBw--71]PWW14123.1 uncharacterized protein DUF3185 [Pseudidiomarina maritima]
MNKLIGIVLLVVGIILLYFGWEAYNSAASELSQMATGETTDNAMWYLIGGAIAVIVGLYGIIRGK